MADHDQSVPKYTLADYASCRRLRAPMQAANSNGFRLSPMQCHDLAHQLVRFWDHDYGNERWHSNDPKQNEKVLFFANSQRVYLVINVSKMVASLLGPEVDISWHPTHQVVDRCSQ